MPTDTPQPRCRYCRAPQPDGCVHMSEARRRGAGASSVLVHPVPDSAPAEPPAGWWVRKRFSGNWAWGRDGNDASNYCATREAAVECCQQAAIHGTVGGVPNDPSREERALQIARQIDPRAMTRQPIPGMPIHWTEDAARIIAAALDDAARPAPAEPSREEPADLEPIRVLLREVAEGGWQDADGVPIPPESARAALATLEPETRAPVYVWNPTGDVCEVAIYEPGIERVHEALAADMWRDAPPEPAEPETRAVRPRTYEELERALEAEERCAQESGGILSDVCDIAFGDDMRAAKHGYDGIRERVREMVTEREGLIATLRKWRDELCPNGSAYYSGERDAYERVLGLHGVDE